MIALTLLCALAPVAPSATLDVVFVPDAANAPIVAITVDDAGKRTLSWAIAGGAAGVLTDDAKKAPPSPWPHAPRGSSVADKGGSLSIIVDDAGAWQDAFRAVPASKGVAGLPLPSSTSLRLAIDPSGDANAAPAVLVGDTVRVAGRAVVRTDAREIRAVVVAGKDVIEAPAAAIDSIAACDKTVPTTASVVGAPSLKLFASGPAVCAGPLALVPVSGTKLDAKKDVPVVGVVVTR